MSKYGPLTLQGHRARSVEGSPSSSGTSPYVLSAPRQPRGVDSCLQVFVERMEAQLHDADGLPIRDRVNNVYERIINSVFGSLQQLAKTDRGEGQATEDKGQLNYHVIMIGEEMPLQDTAVLKKPQGTCATSSMTSRSSTGRLLVSTSNEQRVHTRRTCRPMSS